jgi:hypothetical protein
MAANALQHLHDIESILAFFQRARLHLVRDGLLGLDVFNPDLNKLARRLGAAHPHKQFTLDDGRHVRVEVDSEYFSDSQILHFVLTYRGSEELLLVKDVRMRCFFPEELVGLCRTGGFDVVERFGDFDESPFTANSPKQILLCRTRP